MTTRQYVTAGQRPGQGRERPVYDSYARLSWNPNTRELEKIEDQLSDNLALIDRLSGELGEQLSDGLSAWKRNVRRPGWERLLERAASGESDGIVVWHTDRLFRQPRDLERLIELGDGGFLVASAHGSRDLADADDRFILRIEVAHAARSSDDTSRRLKRRFQTLREHGQSTGRIRPFGFPGLVPMSRAAAAELANDGKERPVVPAEQVERERQAIRDGAADHLAGVPWGKIAERWNADDLRTGRGNAWTAYSVREVLCRPMNAGVIEHKGVPVGQMVGEPILDMATYEKLRGKRASRRPGRLPSHRYVGTGALLCGVCGHALTGRKGNRVRANGDRVTTYYCPKQRGGCGQVNVTMPGVDEQIRLLVIERLSDPEHARQVSAYTTKRAERLAAVQAEIADVEQVGEALSDRLGRMEITVAAFDKANKPLAARLAALVAERQSLLSGELGPVDVATREEIQAQWDAADPLARRTMFVRALGRWRLVVDMAGRRTRIFDPTRLRLVPPDEQTAR